MQVAGRSWGWFGGAVWWEGEQYIQNYTIGESNAGESENKEADQKECGIIGLLKELAMLSLELGQPVAGPVLMQAHENYQRYPGGSPEGVFTPRESAWGESKES